MKKRRIEIRDVKTDAVVHVIETDLIGASYDKLVTGLERKTDHRRYYVHEAETVS